MGMTLRRGIEAADWIEMDRWIALRCSEVGRRKERRCGGRAVP